MQTLTIAGNVGKDATLRQAGDGHVLSFSVAVSNGKDANGNYRPTTWYDCSLFGKRATALERHITKGCKLVLTGRPTVRAHDGKAYIGIVVNELEFMGGGERNDAPREDQRSDGYGAGGRPDFEDSIPFAPSM